MRHTNSLTLFTWLVLLPLWFSAAAANPADLDPSFGSGGTVFMSPGPDARAYAMLVQPDGKIVVAGESATFPFGPTDFVLTRLNPDGSLDTGFGVGGWVRTDFGYYDGVRAIALQPDGKIVAAGLLGIPCFLCSGSGPPPVAVSRYNPDGGEDGSFGTFGKITTNLLGTVNALAIQSDGGIVLVGRSCTANCNFAVMRLTADGSVDSHFGGGGRALTDFGAIDEAFSVAIQSDGRIVVAGVSVAPLGGVGSFAIARYDAAGRPDTTFGNDGQVVSPGFGGTGFGGGRGDGAKAVAVQP